MKIALKNLGKLKSAEFELGDLTVICGENNTGKTYTTYALYGFLHNLHKKGRFMGAWGALNWQEYAETIEILGQKSIDQLLEDGRTQISIEEYAKSVEKIITHLCDLYTRILSNIFASSEKYFEEAYFFASADKEKIDLDLEIKLVNPEDGFALSVSKKSNSKLIDISLTVEDEEKYEQDFLHDENAEYVHDTINEALFDFIIPPIFPKPFIVSAERTGIATFRSELNFARSKLLREMRTIKNDANLARLYRENYTDYPQPINENFDFAGRLGTISKRKSFIAGKHPEILKYLLEIVGGKYIVGDNDIVRYVPSGSDVALTMTESSSSVRSLVDIVFYLQHSAQKGDLLMIDEPELNLHPKNQRKMASLFAMLVNAGIKVFITTHSDYIIHELNTLILLNSQDSRLKKIVKDKEYEKSALLSHEKVKLYTAKQDDKIKGAKNCTLEPVPIDAKKGVETFNEVISDMNKTQQEILYGGG